jgi:hypothetical protein
MFSPEGNIGDSGPGKLKKGLGDILGQIAKIGGGGGEEPEYLEPTPVQNHGIIPQNNVWKSGRDMGQAVLL